MILPIRHTNTRPILSDINWKPSPNPINIKDEIEDWMRLDHVTLPHVRKNYSTQTEIADANEMVHQEISLSSLR